jgi:hypothetical protein
MTDESVSDLERREREFADIRTLGFAGITHNEAVAIRANDLAVFSFVDRITMLAIAFAPLPIH